MYKSLDRIQILQFKYNELVYRSNNTTYVKQMFCDFQVFEQFTIW